MPKFNFRAIFSHATFETKITLKFDSFLEAQNQKIIIFYWENNEFNKIRFFDNIPKKQQIVFRFSETKAKKIPRKNDSKMYCF